MYAASDAVLVTQHYEPEPTGSGPVCAEIAGCLAGREMDLTVLTNRPFYPEGRVSGAYRDGLRDSEKIGGIRIERVAPWLAAGRSAAGRIANHLAFIRRGSPAVANGRVARLGLEIVRPPWRGKGGR